MSDLLVWILLLAGAGILVALLAASIKVLREWERGVILRLGRLRPVRGPGLTFIIPVVMLFRVGDVTALIATVAFAIVPAIRYTNHGIRQVPLELIEAGTAAGYSPARPPVVKSL